MRISRIGFLFMALFTVAAIGTFSGPNAWACGPSCGSPASHGQDGGGGSTPKTGPAITYACPMHPEVKADQPGKCPKCGMNLEKKTEKVAYQYFCSMCPNVVSSKPGNCPKCGMFLEARPSASPAPPAASAPEANPHAGHAH